jgi:TM2 domain-containing membrane protein YozV
MQTPSSSPNINAAAAIENPKSPTLAGWLSFFCCGAGQLYNGDTQKGIILFVIAVTPGLIFGPDGFVLSIPFVIYAIANAVNRSEKINLAYKTNQDTQATALAAENRHVANTIDIDEFAQPIQKAYQLFKNDLLSQEEFTARKKTTIDELALKKPRHGADEFLLGLIPLIKSGALTADEAKAIKTHVL